MSTSWVSSMLGFKQLTASIGADPYQKPDVFYACATVRLLQCCGDQTFEINKKINACNFNQENYVGGRSLAKCKSRQIMQKNGTKQGVSIFKNVLTMQCSLNVCRNLQDSRPAHHHVYSTFIQKREKDNGHVRANEIEMNYRAVK